MNRRAYYLWGFLLAFAGTLFSGFLSISKFVTGNCVLNEPCPYFLGYPSCYFGFGMFLLILFFVSVAWLSKIVAKWPVTIVLLVSLAGVCFAGYFVFIELVSFLRGGAVAYTLGLPSCAYGLIFYILIFIISLRASHYAPVQ